ncbi:MAG: hypothetical protein F4139_00040 [Gemmatimonadetes bacterium]|nr:hypothetical protein [Gemmatimonadota bacterium]MYH51318.1 hypothetical protein [Gemmatimonadota bacterium]MYK66669.1 hypothetical protein [Gemmatimonadota bacterium]
MFPSRFAGIAAAGAALLFATGTSAQSLEEARAAFADGRFLEAANLGEALGTSDGYALAAQSLAVYAHYEASEEEWDEVIERAMQMGDEAVRADSTNAEAYYQSVHAVGRFAKRAGTITALRKGLGGRTRDLLEATLAIDPDHVGANMALGAWHADIDASGFIARKMYGGKKEEAVVHFERALELAPESKVVLYEYAIRLPDLDEENGTQRAREMLEKALAVPVLDAYEDYLHLDVLDAMDDLKNR